MLNICRFRDSGLEICFKILGFRDFNINKTFDDVICVQNTKTAKEPNSSDLKVNNYY